MATKKTSSKSSSSVKKSTRSSTKATIKKPTAAAKATTSAPTVVSDDAPTLNKKEFIDLVMTNSGMKKGEARKAVEATMEALNGALREGKHVNVAPLGKLRLVKSKDTPNGKLAVLRVKLKDPNAAPKDPLADAAE